MLKYLDGINKKMIIEGQEYENISDLKEFYKSKTGTLKIKIASDKIEKIEKIEKIKIYRIQVRQYMTKPPVPEFDFHTVWNKGIAMPFRNMVGTKIKETKGMVYMKLWVEMEKGEMSHCMKCGRILTNNVSKYFGIGPECGGHGYNNPFDTDEELKEAMSTVKKQLSEITWEGWVIKSAITNETIIREE